MNTIRLSLLLFALVAAARTPSEPSSAGPEAAAVRTNREAPLATFALLSDIHIQETDALSHELFVKALQDHYTINRNADMLVLNGDLTNGSAVDFDRLGALLDAVPHAPVRATMGNHDFYRMWLHDDRYDYTRLSGEWSSARAVDQFERQFGYDRPYHEASVRGVPFLFMSGEAYRDVEPSVAEDAYLSDGQLDWLEERLAAFRIWREAGSRPERRLPALVFLHQPLPDTVDGSGAKRGVVQHERLRAILSKYPFAVLFSGHTHWDAETTKQVWRGGFAAVGSGAVRGAYSSADRPIEPLKSESLYVEAYPGRVVVRARDHGAKRWIGEPSVLTFR
ncbi:metallophosphoesterase family protein [Paenibacillus flagellatus]|uniref:Serine/threonine protein phosphatase n=1 Tax=Paenibacillus flagellatus TaxID=2211139 RepID=A0A2V5JZQ8_9BACL|nr:metallophosphoesterase [Paenibacillus flagellatus]PYI50713.1 serine/threonine protein phosphatase [Paenibacillus flagellatus]